MFLNSKGVLSAHKRAGEREIRCLNSKRVLSAHNEQERGVSYGVGVLNSKRVLSAQKRAREGRCLTLIQVLICSKASKERCFNLLKSELGRESRGVF